MACNIAHDASPVVARKFHSDASPGCGDTSVLLPNRDGPSDEELLKRRRLLPKRQTVVCGAFAVAAVLGVVAVCMLRRESDPREQIAWLDKQHPALAALYDSNQPVDFQQMVAFKSALHQLIVLGGATVGTDTWVRVADEAIVTVGETVDSGISRCISGAQVVHFTALSFDRAAGKVRGQLADGGWVSVFDLRSFYSYMDFHPWRAGCGSWLGSRPPGTYIIGMDETAVTIGPTADTALVAVLARNTQVSITEVFQDRRTGWRMRGKLADGAGWITLTNVYPCEERAYFLPPVSANYNRKGSFLVVGDWGWDPHIHWTVKKRFCQELIATRMLQKFWELGDVKFIVNVGDSFYPNGVWSSDDEQWQSKWRDVFSQQLRDVPWYTVYGNHDLHVDPCSCTQNDAECAQVNPNTGDRSRFYMPSPSYYAEHPDLNTEVVALDFNAIGDPNVCHFTSCEGQCRPVMWRRFNEARNLLDWRIKASPHKNMVIFSHYPSDYLRDHPDIMGPLHDRRHNIVYLGGHRHSTDSESVTPIWPHQSWVVGGGGGLSCDGAQGFLVGEIDTNDNIRTYPVIIPYDACCQ